MSLVKRQLTLVLVGRLDQRQLDDVCANTGLVAVGSATDPVGSQLGCLERHHPRHRMLTEVAVSLTRTDTDEWSLTVDAVPGEEANRWRCLSEIACRASGLTIKYRELPPERRSLSAAEKKVIALEADRYIDAGLSERGDVVELDQAEPEAGWIDDGAFLALLDRLESAGTVPPWEPVVPRRAIEVHELIELVTELRSMVWSWSTDDLRPIGVFGWEPLEAQSHGVLINPRLGIANGFLHSDGDSFWCIDIPVAVEEPAAQGSLGLNTQFYRMFTALVDMLGQPTERDSTPRTATGWEFGEKWLVVVQDRGVIRLLFESVGSVP